MGRIIATGVLLLLAIGGFCGIADGNAGPLSPVGLLFLLAAGVFWRHWQLIAGAYSPPHLHRLLGRLVGDSVSRSYHRAAGDHDRGDAGRSHGEPD